MIKANELRIGNWLNYNYDLGNNLSRYEMVESYLLVDILEGDDFPYEPIPLTPEILEKAEFEKSGDYFEHSAPDNDDDNQITFIYRDDVFMIKEYTRVISQDIVSLPVKVTYLHQLQNLFFSLTGTELEIKL